VLPVVATAQHADIRPDVENGRIVTSGFVDATSETLPDLRVFGYDFQEDPLDPYFAADPGINASSSALPVGSQLSFNILDGMAFGLPGNLSYWNGAGSVNFGTVPSGESLRLNFGAQSRTAGSAGGEIGGFAISAIGLSGSIHRHLNSFLEGADGNSTPGDGVVAANGIYLLPIELSSSETSIADSLPLFLVYNNGLTEAVHDQTIDWVEQNLVPEPPANALAFVALGLVIVSLIMGRGAFTKTTDH